MIVIAWSHEWFDLSSPGHLSVVCAQFDCIYLDYQSFCFQALKFPKMETNYFQEKNNFDFFVENNFLTRGLIFDPGGGGETNIFLILAPPYVGVFILFCNCIGNLVSYFRTAVIVCLYLLFKHTMTYIHKCMTLMVGDEFFLDLFLLLTEQ